MTAILDGADLRRSDFWKADLSGAELEGANLEQAIFTGASLHGANLARASLYQADINGADLRAANLDHAGVIGIKYDRRAMRGRYQGIRGVESSYGDALFRRDAVDQDYIDTLALRWRRSPLILIFALWALIDYGRSLSRILLLASVGGDRFWCRLFLPSTDNILSHRSGPASGTLRSFPYGILEFWH